MRRPAADLVVGHGPQAGEQVGKPPHRLGGSAHWELNEVATKSVHMPHVEQHFTGSETIRDIVIGMSDGLTVPFALAAGLAGAVANHWLIVIAGASELAAGAIAMGLGGYLAARSDADAYAAELVRERREIVELPERERDEVRAIFAGYGLTPPALEAATAAVTAQPQTWLRFMMKEELGLDEPHPQRALVSGLTIGLAYIAGG